MATIKEYLKYYKSLTFNECKLNINDVLLFTEGRFSPGIPKGCGRT